MISPECEKGVVVELRNLPQVKDKAVRRYLKATPCPRCNGSGIAYCCDGEDASQPDVSAGDLTSAGKDRPMVT